MSGIHKRTVTSYDDDVIIYENGASSDPRLMDNLIRKFFFHNWHAGLIPMTILDENNKHVMIYGKKIKKKQRYLSVIQYPRNEPMTNILIIYGANRPIDFMRIGERHVHITISGEPKSKSEQKEYICKALPTEVKHTIVVFCTKDNAKYGTPEMFLFDVYEVFRTYDTTDEIVLDRSLIKETSIEEVKHTAWFVNEDREISLEMASYKEPYIQFQDKIRQFAYDNSDAFAGIHFYFDYRMDIHNHSRRLDDEFTPESSKRPRIE